jgi:hypothetical protein
MLINDPLLQQLMAGNRAPATPGQRLEPGRSNPLPDIIQQALADQQRGQALKAQIMQALGFGGNPMPMGAIPRNAGVTIMDGQAMTRPGGMPQQAQQLLQALMGVEAGGMHSQGSAGSLTNLAAPSAMGPMERPGPVGAPVGNNDPGFVLNAYQTAQQQGDIGMIEFLERNYPQLFGIEQQNTGMPFYNRSTRPGRGTF